MYRQVFFRWALVLGLVSCIVSIHMGCPSAPPEEPAPQDATTPETRPEPPPVRDDAPDGKQQPAGVGDKCTISPIAAKGTCPSDSLLCGSISNTESICFENCSKTNECALPNEQCTVVQGLSKFPACVLVADKGADCGLDKRTICRGELVDPPQFCVDGKCTERPKDGWDVDQACSPPSGTQSDCKAGLLCMELAKGVYRCAKKCDQDGDCPNGESCWEEPLNTKVCVIAAKSGEKCNNLERRFCRTENKLNPLDCKTGVCKPRTELKQVGETCIKSVLPGEERGNCDQGMLCLGVSDREAVCHTACNTAADCPSGEACASHPNLGPGDPARACVKPIKAGGTCDLKTRSLCEQPAGKYYKCDRPDDTTTEGKCVEINVGDGCVNDNDCGAMRCIAINPMAADKKYCLVPCDPAKPACPGNGACQAWGMNGPNACVPTGPKQQDEACTALQAVGDKLDLAKACTGGVVCVTFEQGNPAGVCMKRVVQCAAGACDAKHVCLPAGQTAFCGLDCSTDKSVCKSGTTCRELTNPKASVCGP